MAVRAARHHERAQQRARPEAGAVEQVAGRGVEHLLEQPAVLPELGLGVPLELPPRAAAGHQHASPHQLEPGDRLVADANTGWVQHEAVRVANAVRDIDVYIEQPCLTYEECLAVRRHTDHPFVLDENVDGLDMLLRAKADLAMDVVNLKISKLGGLTKTRQVRDLCVSMGIAMTLEDSWGGDVTTAAIAHLAHGTPEEFRFTSTDFNSYVTVSTAEGAPQREQGYMAASQAPGLGVQPRLDVLGPRVLEVT